MAFLFLMTIQFSKYQGTGNDFILIDNRKKQFNPDVSLIQRMTDRRFGIGADGMMLIENDDAYDFKMIYFNADGSQSLCGNGSRCAVHFANHLGMIDKETNFITTDGLHHAFIENEKIHFQLHDIKDIGIFEEYSFIDNGSPHHIRFVENLKEFDVVGSGRSIRYSDQYPKGTNVNFVEISEKKLLVRTYERGVENETLSCGTGVTASAIAASFRGLSSPIDIETPGGTLSVSFEKQKNGVFSKVYLSGPAVRVFDGSYTVK